MTLPDDAVERLPGRPDSAWVLTCEHASEHLPAPYAWTSAERALLGTHWAVDLGAAAITRALSRRLGAPALLARFSRLLLDPNREPGHPTMFRTRCDDVDVVLNAALDDAERTRRLERFHVPFHAAIDEAVRMAPQADVLSIHSFTPVYEGGLPRPMELGVLYDHDEALAHDFAAVLEARGFRVALNEPYTGKGGLMYSADRHARAHGRRAVEIEVRQDLASEPAEHARIVGALAAAAEATARPRGA
jgi:predicted N-formylglutamate amidohydrolase